MRTVEEVLGGGGSSGVGNVDCTGWAIQHGAADWVLIENEPNVMCTTHCKTTIFLDTRKRRDREREREI